MSTPGSSAKNPLRQWLEHSGEPEGHDVTATARKLAPTAIAVVAASSVAFSSAVAAQPTNPAAPQSFQPCDWVTSQEAADILGKPVTLEPTGGAEGPGAPRCFYAASGAGIGVGISSELLLPGASAVDANSTLAHAAAEPGAQAIGGLGLRAVCVFEPQVTPPSTTILVLLDGSRLYRATAAYKYCDTVERFARTAVDRIPG
jgi:hypothetical protein